MARIHYTITEVIYNIYNSLCNTKYHRDYCMMNLFLPNFCMLLFISFITNIFKVKISNQIQESFSN